MKINLAENMLRFGVKNLNETAKHNVKMLAEQAPIEPVTAPGQTQEPTSNTLAPLNIKSLDPIKLIYGQQPIDYLNANWNKLKPGYIHLPSAQGVLTALLRDPADYKQGAQNAVMSFVSFTRVSPVTVTVPPEMIMIKNPDPKGVAFIKAPAGTKPITFTLLTAMQAPFEGDNTWLETVTISGKTNNKPFVKLANGKAPGIPKINISTKWLWGNALGKQNISYYEGRSGAKFGGTDLQYQGLMAEFIKTKLLEGFEDRYGVLKSDAFKVHASMVTPKPGTMEMIWAKVANDQIVNAIYNSVAASSANM